MARLGNSVTETIFSLLFARDRQGQQRIPERAMDLRSPPPFAIRIDFFDRGLCLSRGFRRTLRTEEELCQHDVEQAKLKLGAHFCIERKTALKFFDVIRAGGIPSLSPDPVQVTNCPKIANTNSLARTRYLPC